MARKARKKQPHPEHAQETVRLRALRQECTDKVRQLTVDLERDAWPVLDSEDQYEADLRQYRISMAIDHLRDIFGDPYFGRIRFNRHGGDLEDYYVSYHEGENLDAAHLVYWKAPVADLYFSRRELFRSPEGVVRVVLDLVRQLDLQGDTVLTIVDHFSRGAEGEFLDPLLLKQLQRTGRDRLRKIVPTIQAEQNDIIRAPAENNVVIQGGAGTGKTIALLHRVAYLMYHHRWSADDVLFVTPSRLFARYALVLLPDLDVKGLSTTSVADFIPGLAERMSRLAPPLPPVSELAPQERPIAMAATEYKGTVEFKTFIDSKLDEVLDRFAKQVPPFEYQVHRVASYSNHQAENRGVHAERLGRWLKDDFGRLPVIQRVEKIRERLEELLAQEVDVDHNSIFTTRQIKIMLDRYLRAWQPLHQWATEDVFGSYAELLADPVAQGLAIPREVPPAQHDDWLRYFGHVGLNDLGALCYLAQRLTGTDRWRHFRHIIVDEAHRLSVLWYAAFADLMAKRATMTVCGDLYQKSELAGLTRWNELQDVIGDFDFRELSVSYRTTDEIAELANKVLRTLASEHKLLLTGRKGAPVRRLEGNRSARHKQLAPLIREMLKEYETVGVIGRTRETCENAWADLRPELAGHDIQLIADPEQAQLASIVALPVYWAAGLEFDCVIVLDADDYQADDEFDNRLRYVAVTRAVHQLVLA